jgi:hypothetical protein
MTASFADAVIPSLVVSSAVLSGGSAFAADVEPCIVPGGQVVSHLFFLRDRLRSFD